MTSSHTIKSNNGFKISNDLAIDILARTLWGEARGEGPIGMRAVAHVVNNRVALAHTHGGAWLWGNDFITVCRKPYQFSCWNLGDPSRAKLIVIDARNREFRTARTLASAVINKTDRDDPTFGATHYHRFDISPKWAHNLTPTTKIGAHIFYDLSDEIH